jgi:hypothetical protein
LETGRPDSVAQKLVGAVDSYDTTVQEGEEAEPDLQMAVQGAYQCKSTSLPLT